METVATTWVDLAVAIWGRHDWVSAMAAAFGRDRRTIQRWHAAARGHPSAVGDCPREVEAALLAIHAARATRQPR